MSVIIFSYVIYNKKTTKILSAPARSVGCYIESYRTAPAARAALTRLDNKGKLGSNFETDPKTLERTETPYIKEDFAIAESTDFRDNIEKTVTRRNAMTGEEFQESINANYATSPSSENYWAS